MSYMQRGEGKIIAPDRNNPNDVIHPNRERILQNIGQLHRNKCILICLTLINPSLMLTGRKHFSLEAKSVHRAGMNCQGSGHNLRR